MDTCTPIQHIILTVLLAVGVLTTTPCRDEVPGRRGGLRSCEPCDVITHPKMGRIEVHVRSLQPSASSSGTYTVKVTLKDGVPPRPVRLVLVSAASVTWVLQPDDLVYIDKVVSVTRQQNTPSSVTVGQEFYQLANKGQADLFDGAGVPNSEQVRRFVLSEPDTNALTSYRSDFKNATLLDVVLGECDGDTTAPAPCYATSDVESCLATWNCAVKMPFISTAHLVDCKGAQYILKYRTFYVGIVLCEPNRFKLLMSALLRGPYLDIADRVPYGTLYGADHCLLLGQPEAQAHTADWEACPSNTLGFYRNSPPQHFKYGKICGEPSTPEYTGLHTPRWYSCNNVSIPQMFSRVHEPEHRCSVEGNSSNIGSSVAAGPSSRTSYLAGAAGGGALLLLLGFAFGALYHRRARINQRRGSPMMPTMPEPIYTDILPPPTGHLEQPWGEYLNIDVIYDNATLRSDEKIADGQTAVDRMSDGQRIVGNVGDSQNFVDRMGNGQSIVDRMSDSHSDVDRIANGQSVVDRMGNGHK